MRKSERGSQKTLCRRLATMLTALIIVLGAPDFVASQDMSAHHRLDSLSDDATIVQDWAQARLAKSPRHREWVKVKNGNREVNSFVVYPEVNKKATAVVVIHEIFGMSDWVQELSDELAEAGYIAIAPDLLSGMGPNGGGTDDVATKGSTAVGTAIRALQPDQIASDLNAVSDYVSKVPGANGKVAVAGFCWGGTQTFAFATNRPSLKAAFVFYGSAPANNPQGQPYAVDKTALGRIKAPVYGFYAGNDMRINATIEATTAAMKELNKQYEPVTYAGTGHGFMRAGEAPPPVSPASQPGANPDRTAMESYGHELTTFKANQKARNEAWARWKAILAKL